MRRTEVFTLHYFFGLFPFQVRDVTHLASCPNLNEVVMANLAVSDLSPFSSLKHLHTLDARGTPVSNIDAIAECSSLTVLGIF